MNTGDFFTLVRPIYHNVNRCSSKWFFWTFTHWGRVTHICVGKLTIIGSDNGLSLVRRQAIIWTNAGLLSIGPLRTYFSENLIKIQQFSLKKMHVKMSSAKWRPSCLGLNVLIRRQCVILINVDILPIYTLMQFGWMHTLLVHRHVYFVIKLCASIYYSVRDMVELNRCLLQTKLPNSSRASITK